ncbi:alanine racemase [Rhizobium sp. 768_B6_N1_8]|jgi:predicted amino acid racemase|uniref:alanine racemase n=1 Tax=unclassified Rhizobium TaxID=2613769 RepID=UPI003F2079A7
MAELAVNLKSIEANLQFIKADADRNGLELVFVVKPCHDYAPILQLVDRQAPAYLGMSKIQIARNFSAQLKTPVMTTSLPTALQAEDIVRYSKASLNSDPSILDALDSAAEKHGVKHGYFLMVDVGDLREGVLPHEAPAVMRAILAKRHRNLVFEGFGTNYACANGVQPSHSNLSCLYRLARDLGQEGISVPKISLGGSSIIHWMSSEILASWPTQVRIGQAALLGTIPVADEPFVGLRTDTLRFCGTIVEIQDKPAGIDGGGAVADLGVAATSEIRKRAILDFGVVDADPKALIPREAGVRIVTANSDYTVIDVTGSAESLRIGSSIYFDLKYRAMLQGFLSPYLSKRVVEHLS